MSLELKIQDFDRTDGVNIGRPLYFDVDQYLSCVEQMITADEVERAMWMLDNMPAWYRANYPENAKKIKHQLLRQFFRPLDYAKNGEAIADTETALKYLSQPHGQILLELVKDLNRKGIAPHIEEMAPGNYWVAEGLRANSCSLTYHGPSLNPKLEAKVFQCDANSDATIFVCFETIEHLEREDAIYHHFVKECEGAKYIFLSTPQGVFSGGQADWYKQDLGHLRTYTPKEFASFAMKYWPEFTWKLYQGGVMTLVGERV